MKKQAAMVVLGWSLFLISVVFLSGCRAADVEVAAAQPEIAGVVYAMDAVDQKLFDAAARATSPLPQSAGAVYALDAVDQRLFNAAERALSESAQSAAADNMAARWQAMGAYYEAQGLLTRDTFDYEQAADNTAARWQAMASFYQTYSPPNQTSGQ